MSVHDCPGLRPAPLAYYLAALGLAKVVGEQADPDARCGWTGDTFFLDTTLPDITSFLVTAYRPTPVLSPWNSGSGFGSKDKGQKEFLARLESSRGARLQEYRSSIKISHDLMGDPGWDAWPKERQVQELRNWLPDSALPWLDAAVVLTGDGPMYPPTLGTGGNDGRLDYSTNYHQRLTNVLPELGADTAASQAWADDLLTGRTSQPLVSAAIGQNEPLAAGGPGSSSHGAADSLTNPWLFVLMIEGLTWFAATPSRRLGEAKGTASMPFVVRSSPDGPNPGAEDEGARGELWAPVFERVTVRHLRQIMSEARATWAGATAQTALDMYGAVHTYGVDRGVAAFERYGFLQRNGKAFVSTHLDHIVVQHRPAVAAAARPMGRAAVFRRAPGSATASAARLFDRVSTDFFRDPSPEHLLDLLTRQTRLEIAATRNPENRQHLPWPGPLLEARIAVAALKPILASSPEARVAAGLASAFALVRKPALPLRGLLLGRDRDRDEKGSPPVAAGIGLRPTVEVLADALVWLSRQDVTDPRVERGWLPVHSHRFKTRWEDIHAWAAGYLDDARVDEYLLAFLAVDWRSAMGEDPLSSIEPHRSLPIVTIDPDLAVLQALASGQVIGVGVPPQAEDGRVGLRREWAIRLRAGQVHSVGRDAAALLGRSLVRVGSKDRLATRRYERRYGDTYNGRPVLTGVNDPGRGIRLLAALLAPATTGPLRRVAVPIADSQTSINPSQEGAHR